MRLAGLICHSFLDLGQKLIRGDLRIGTYFGLLVPRRGKAVLAEIGTFPQHQMALHAVALRRMVQTKFLGDGVGLLPSSGRQLRRQRLLHLVGSTKVQDLKPQIRVGAIPRAVVAVPELARVAVLARAAL